MNMFGNLGNMGEMIKQAKKMQDELKKIKDDLKHARYEAEVNGIKVIVDGEMEVKEIRLPACRQAWSGDSDIRGIEEKIRQAVNKAIKESKDDAARRLKGATGGISIPGLT